MIIIFMVMVRIKQRKNYYCF